MAMSSMKKSMGMMTAMMAMAGMFDSPASSYGQGKSHRLDEDPETPEEKKSRLKRAEEKINKANGLKEFIYPDGGSVWAVNQKNADKKYNKQILKLNQ